MADSNWGEFRDVFDYLSRKEYQEGLDKVGKRTWRQKAESFVVQDGVLMHKSGIDTYHLTPTPPAWWVRDLNLTSNDRDVIARGDWLNDKVVDAVNGLVAKHLQLPGNQSSLLAQSQSSPVEQAVRIMYDSSHWVAVAGDDDHVLVANSLGDTVSPIVRKQLKELFRGRVDAEGQLRIGVVTCMQQPKSCDCGMFAAAFVFEWAANSLHANLDTLFDVARMRQHLIHCLQRHEVAPFPQTRPQRQRKQRAAQYILV